MDAARKVLCAVVRKERPQDRHLEHLPVVQRDDVDITTPCPPSRC